MTMLQINQVLDAWFNKGFKGSKCKTLLKLTSSRIRLLKNKRENHLKQLRRELAQLLQNDQESTARIRVEHIIRETNIMEAYEILEHFCELLIVRMRIMELQRECPLDLKEAVASLIFAAPRASDLPELQEMQTMLTNKYGTEFVASAVQLRPDCGVNRMVIEKLSAGAPTATVKLNVMKEIAEQHNFEWDSASTELEFSKAPQDLLDGPPQFLGPIQMSPIPLHDDEAHSQRSISAAPQLEGASSKPTPTVGRQSGDQTDEHEFVPPPPNYGVKPRSFYSPPRESSITQQSSLLEETLAQKSHSRAKSEGSMDLSEIIEAAEAAAETTEQAARAARAAAELTRARCSPKSSKKASNGALLQSNGAIPASQGSKEASSIILIPDHYDWTQEYSGKQEQERDSMLDEQRGEEDEGHQETLVAQGSHGWMDERKQEQHSYDWRQDSYGRKHKDDLESIPDKQRIEGMGQSKDYIFDDDREGNVSADEASQDEESIFNASRRGAPKFDGADAASYSEPFRRQPSFEEDSYYAYPNLFSKS